MRTFLVLTASLVLSATAVFAQTNQVDPPLPDGTEKAIQQIAALRTPPGWKVELFAAEPQLHSPVALGLDEQGRVFVAEEYRLNRGTEENRTRSFLLDEDLQVDTLDQRLALFQRHADRFDGGMDWFSRWTDRVVTLEDTDGDGRADKSTTFADGFNDPLDGMAAGVLAYDGDVYLTCIPHLWRLRDRDGDGVAESKEKLVSGFGVNCGFLGHDLHGLVFGPDGKLYFSVGDRGYRVETPDGRLHAEPRRGAVFRCEPDGSEFEVVHRGLRNPQELAFDDFGNLFADDNNCDKGDHARLVYVVEGGDSGWNMAFQSMGEPYLTGPWHAEKMWTLQDFKAPDPAYPRWLTPAVGALGSGPSGFLHDPGVLPPALRGCFLMCNYTGNGGLEAIRVHPRGAGFELVETVDFLKPISASDVEFGYDGKLYVSDFVGLDWSGKSVGGRVYTAFSPEIVASEQVTTTKRLFWEGFAKRADQELLTLLAHGDQRVRQRAQFELARRGPRVRNELVKLAASDAAVLPRLHALWALGQIAKTDRSVLPAIAERLSDKEIELRAHAAKLVGDHRHEPAIDNLIAALRDDSPRVRYFAVQSLGKLKAESAVGALAELVTENAGLDRYLEHALVQAVAKLGLFAQPMFLNSVEPERRMIGTLALRANRDPAIAHSLNDPNREIVLEAARAIHDLSLDSETESLSRLLSRMTREPALAVDPLVRRALAASSRVGRVAQVDAALDLLALPGLSSVMRRETLETLRDWAEPAPRDRVTGSWRPTPQRDTSGVAERLVERTADVLSAADGETIEAALALIDRWKLPVDDATLQSAANDVARSDDARVAALRLLGKRAPELARKSLEDVLRGQSPTLAAKALSALATIDRSAATTFALQWLGDDAAAVPQRQAAIASIGSDVAAFDSFTKWLERATANQVPVELAVDILEAAKASADGKIKEKAIAWESELKAKPPEERFAMALAGGDAERGKAVFRGHARAQCVRCHKVEGAGGDAGPELTKIAEKRDAAYLLEALVRPDAKIAEGFGTVTLALDSGRLLTGVVKKETATELTLRSPMGDQFVETVVPIDSIEERTAPKSPMPPMENVLTPREMRDLVAFLRSLR